jgi:hypothetical protein
VTYGDVSSLGLALTLALAPFAALGADGPIRDNSFLIEEAYNQEPGVIHHTGTFARARTGGWTASYTEEWPVLGETHQASVTFNAAQVNDAAGMSDVALNYRYQAVDRGWLALAPRISVLLPAGDSTRGLGSGTTGLQVNVPLSVELHRFAVAHVNAGGTWLPAARTPDGVRGTLAMLSGGASLIALVHPKLNVLLEALYTTSAHSLPAGTARTETLNVSPGVRAAIDVGSLQIVPGIAMPIGLGPSAGERAVFLYLSFEHPFWLAGPTEPPPTT